jgi:hypothetical protein
MSPDGRRALRAWLDEPGAAPYIEIEDALKVTHATAGSLDQLRANLLRMRAQLDARGEVMVTGLRDLLAEGFTVPERLHTSALVAELVRRVGRAMADWALWAEETIESWDDLEIDETKRAWALATYEDMARELEEVLRQDGSAARSVSPESSSPTVGTDS